MKHLIYFFLLFSTVVFSQNYNYGIDEPQKQIVVPIVNNQLEEIEYFKAYLLPVSQKANLQKAIDTYGAVRLEKGDYRGVNITLHSNQKLYGYPSYLTLVSSITIASGSTGVVLEDLLPYDNTLTLQSGGVISGCTFKSIRWCTLSGTNVMFENNTLINYEGNIQIDCSASGYFRNNKIIRQQTGANNGLVLKGNNNTPSYGNTHLWTNFLTPHGDATDINGLQSANFVGLDGEGWNLLSEGTKAMFDAKNMGTLKIADFQGGSYNPTPNIAYDIDADNLTFYNKWLYTLDDVISPETNMFYVSGYSEPKRRAGTVTGFDIASNTAYGDKDLRFNGTIQTATITNSTDVAKISNTILGTQHTPWARPSWETIPNPLGASWSTDRIGKPDSRAYIQNLIDTNSIAELPEGVFYISSTLFIPNDKLHGITGKGTGKTVICGLTDNFPLISLQGGNTLDGTFTLAYLTLQGGSGGLYASQAYGGLNIAYQRLKFVVFRNQNAGIHLYQTGGFDNCFIDNLSFIDCNIGFFQDPLRTDNGELSSTYIDKTMFYKNQFINCNQGVSMMSTRASNLDAWVDCKFDNNRVAMNTSGLATAIVTNCDFTNNTGSAPSGERYGGTYKENNVVGGSFGFYSCNFSNNTAAYVFNTKDIFLEGCNLLDNITLFASSQHNENNYYIVNSTVTGSLGSTSTKNGVFVNSNLKSYPAYSKLLVHLKNNVATTIIDATPNPYPQLLVSE